MCGIVGVFSKFSQGLTNNEVTTFTHMLYADAIRGWDSTGVVGINKYGNGEWFKREGNPLFLMNEEDYQKYIRNFSTKGMALFGHNRKATVGTISDHTAHPFVHEHIIAIHNGNISNYKQFSPEATVDSSCIPVLLAGEDYHTALDKLVGAFAIVWYNVNTKKIHMCRNSQRPLGIVETSQSFYIASESEMAEWFVSRSNQAKTSVRELKPGWVYTYDIVNQKLSVEEDVFGKTPVNFPIPSTSQRGSKGKKNSGSSSSTVVTTDFRRSLPGRQEGEDILFLVQDISIVEDKHTGAVKYELEGTNLNHPFDNVFVECDIDTISDLEDGCVLSGKFSYSCTIGRIHGIRLSPNSLKKVYDTLPEEFLDDALYDDEFVLDEPEKEPETKPNNVVKMKPRDGQKVFCKSLNGYEITNHMWQTMKKTCSGTNCRNKLLKEALVRCIVNPNGKKGKKTAMQVWCPTCSVNLQQGSISQIH